MVYMFILNDFRFCVILYIDFFFYILNSLSIKLIEKIDLENVYVFILLVGKNGKCYGNIVIIF